MACQFEGRKIPKSSENPRRRRRTCGGMCGGCLFTDVDECRLRTANCNGEDDVCVNTRGGYKCQTVTCPRGFVKSPVIGNRSKSDHLHHTIIRYDSLTCAGPRSLLQAPGGKNKEKYKDKPSYRARIGDHTACSN